MNFIRENDKIYTKNEEGKITALVDFPFKDDKIIKITHTFVDESLRGKGVAKLLVDEVCKVAESEGLKIIPVCSYAVNYFEKYTEYKHLLK